MLGTYRPTSTAGTWGYHLGTWASMAVGLCFGSTEIRIANVAGSSIKKIPALIVPVQNLFEKPSALLNQPQTIHPSNKFSIKSKLLKKLLLQMRELLY